MIENLLDFFLLNRNNKEEMDPFVSTIFMELISDPVRNVSVGTDAPPV